MIRRGGEEEAKLGNVGQNTNNVGIRLNRTRVTLNSRISLLSSKRSWCMRCYLFSMSSLAHPRKNKMVENEK